jgi:hypothetical protein
LKPRFVPQLVKVIKGAYEGFLADIICAGGIAITASEANSVDFVFITAEQMLKGMFITHQGGLNQRLIRYGILLT